MILISRWCKAVYLLHYGCTIFSKCFVTQKSYAAESQELNLPQRVFQFSLPAWKVGQWYYSMCIYTNWDQQSNKKIGHFVMKYPKQGKRQNRTKHLFPGNIKIN